MATLFTCVVVLSSSPRGPVASLTQRSQSGTPKGDSEAASLSGPRLSTSGGSSLCILSVQPSQKTSTDPGGETILPIGEKSPCKGSHIKGWEKFKAISSIYYNRIWFHLYKVEKQTKLTYAVTNSLAGRPGGEAEGDHLGPWVFYAFPSSYWLLQCVQWRKTQRAVNLRYLTWFMIAIVELKVKNTDSGLKRMKCLSLSGHSWWGCWSSSAPRGYLGPQLPSLLLFHHLVLIWTVEAAPGSVYSSWREWTQRGNPGWTRSFQANKVEVTHITSTHNPETSIHSHGHAWLGM